MPAAYDSAAELARALRRAAAAQGEHEEGIGHAGADWPACDVRYMVDEKAGHSAGSAQGAGR